MKKFFAYLLALCMVLGMLPATALATEGEGTEPQAEAPAEQVEVVNEAETEGETTGETSTVAEEQATYVAQIGETEYVTLAAAVEAAEAGATVKLLKDATGDGMVINKNITIDLGGHIYTVNTPVGDTGVDPQGRLGLQLLKNNNIVLQNGTLKANNENVKFLVQNYANLTLTDITLDGRHHANCSYVLSNNNGTTKMNGATSIIANAGAVAFDVYDYASGGYSGVSVEVNTTGSIDGKIEVDGDREGGNRATLTIKGGTFSDLANAVKYAEAGATVTLLKDAEGDGMVINKNITIDLGGKTYTVKTPVGDTGVDPQGRLGLQLLKNNNIVLQNGTLKANNENVKFLVQNYANLTLTDITLDGRHHANCSYVLSNNNGNTKMSGATSIIANAGAVAFDVYDYASGGYSGVSVEVNTTGSIDGKIEVDGDREGGNRATLTIKGGTFSDLANAVKHAEDGATIKLGADVTISEKLSITKNLTIDGNGKTLTYTGSDRAIEVSYNESANINLTIENLTVDCTGSYCQRGINYNENGTLTLTNVTVKGTNVTYALNLPGKSTAATVNISGGSYTGCIALNIWGANSEVNVTNAALTSVDTATHENYAAISLNNDGTTSAEGTVVTVTGGSITALDENDDASLAVRNSTDTATVSVSDTTVVNGISSVMVAIVDYGYPEFYSCFTLQDAITKATGDATATVKLLKAVTEDITVNGAVKMDLNGKTLHGGIKLVGAGSTLTAVDGETAVDNLSVESGTEGYIVSYNDGTYSLVEGYTVTFHAGGNGSFIGGPLTHVVSVPAGKSVRDVLNATNTYVPDPVREGYTFGKGYTIGDSDFSIAAPVNSNIDVYAKWTATEYTITYNLNGGSASNPATYTIESADITLVNPTRSGYNFAGWTGTGLSSATTTVTIASGSTGDREYTATWNEIYYEPYYPTYTPSTPSTPSTSTETTENEDGSTTTTVTDNKTGTVTETTENVDGSTTTVETQKDGTVTEKVENTDGSSTTTETKSETTTNKDGSTTTTTATKTESTDASGATVTETKTEEKVETETGSVTTSTTEVKSEDKTEVTETKAETTVKEDGTTETKTESTTTATDAAGNVTTSTTTATETTTVKEDGATVTEKVEETKSESAEATVETKTTATTTATEEKTETVAVTEETVTKADGTTETKTTTTTETALADGTTGTATTDESGKTEATVTVSEQAAAAAAESGAAVALPIPAVTTTTESEAAATVTVTTNSTEDTKVEIPVAEVSTSTVAVIVNEDGTETVITETRMSENGLVIDVPDGATVKIVDNSTAFDDVADEDWEQDAVNFSSARGLVNGVGNNAFDLDGVTTRAHVVTLLARLAGVDTTPDEGKDWHHKGEEWAVENGITYAGSMNKEITRHEMMTLLWRFVGSPESDHDIGHFTDTHELTVHTETAARWAVEIGLVQGHGDNTMTPTGTVTRGQLAQFMMNFVQKT